MPRKSRYTKAQWLWAADRIAEGYFINEVAKFLGVHREILRRHMIALGYLPELRSDLPDLSKRRDEFLALGNCEDEEVSDASKTSR